MTIRRVLVLGAGSAGLLTAIALRRKLPQLTVEVVRSPDIGVIGVGEGTTPLFPQMLFGYLGLERARFYAEAQPTWKLGGRFYWGPRRWFDYPFELSYDATFQGLPKATGFYCDDDTSGINLPAALMSCDKAFVPRADGWPEIKEYFAFHVENVKLVGFLENCARSLGIELTDGTVMDGERGPHGLSALRLASGARLAADLFVDASGFRSELLGRALEVPHHDFGGTLFCDRAVIGGWSRTDEPIKPYTAAETMKAGWCWQIEHEHWINRGYVYGSRFISDDEASAEFLQQNPKVTNEPRVVKFRSGRYAETWKGNVVGVGNASGFVEPLEATALTVILIQAKLLVQTLWHSDFAPTSSIIAVYNRRISEAWDDTRDFLALHYKFNTRLQTPFWRAAREESDLANLDEFLNFYAENGPTPMSAQALPGGRAIYGLDGHLAILVGSKVPYGKRHTPSPAEISRWREITDGFHAQARSALDVRQTLEAIRHPAWNWAAQTNTQIRTALRL